MGGLLCRWGAISYVVDPWLYNLIFLNIFVFVVLAATIFLKFGEILMGTLELALRYFKFLRTSLLVFGELIRLKLTVPELLL